VRGTQRGGTIGGAMGGGHARQQEVAGMIKGMWLVDEQTAATGKHT